MLHVNNCSDMLRPEQLFFYRELAKFFDVCCIYVKLCGTDYIRVIKITIKTEVLKPENQFMV